MLPTNVVVIPTAVMIVTGGGGNGHSVLGTISHTRGIPTPRPCRRSGVQPQHAQLVAWTHGVTPWTPFTPGLDLCSIWLIISYLCNTWPSFGPTWAPQLRLHGLHYYNKPDQ